MMKVIGVTGLQGSGKSIFFDTAKEKGALVVSMGDIIREKAAERGEDTGTTARTLREEFGQYIVAELTVQKIKDLFEKDNSVKTVLIDGIRSPYEIELFKENFEKLGADWLQKVKFNVSCKAEISYTRELGDRMSAGGGGK